jgi:hypothetical protein
VRCLGGKLNYGRMLPSAIEMETVKSPRSRDFLIPGERMQYNGRQARSVSERPMAGAFHGKVIRAWMTSDTADLRGLMVDPDDILHPRPHWEQEYQDSRFHDDDEVIPADDVQPRRTRPPVQRKPIRRPPPRRRYEDD